MAKSRTECDDIEDDRDEQDRMRLHPRFVGSGGGGLVNLLITTYGPYAFGPLVLLVIWSMAIKPELDRRSIDLQAQLQMQLQISDNSRKAAEAGQHAAEAFERAAQTLNRATRSNTP